MARTKPKDPLLGLQDPFQRLITVMERGIYFKKFKKTWREVDPTDGDYLQMFVPSTRNRPLQQKEPRNLKKHLEAGFKVHFIAAGANDPMNAVIDWTKMKSVNFFRCTC